MKTLTNILILLISYSFFGQITSKINLNKTLSENLEKNEIEIADETRLYINDEISNELFYYALKPKEKIKGTLILLPPTAQKVENVINNNIVTLMKLCPKGVAQKKKDPYNFLCPPPGLNRRPFGH